MSRRTSPCRWKAASSTSPSRRSTRASRRSGALSGLAKLMVYTKQSQIRFFGSAHGRRRRGLPLRRQAGHDRHRPTTGCTRSGTFKDTVKGGPVIGGAGIGIYYEADTAGLDRARGPRAGGLPDLLVRRRREPIAAVQLLRRRRPVSSRARFVPEPKRTRSRVAAPGPVRGLHLRAPSAGSGAASATPRIRSAWLRSGGPSPPPRESRRRVEVGGRRAARAVKLLGGEVERRSGALLSTHGGPRSAPPRRSPRSPPRPARAAAGSTA